MPPKLKKMAGLRLIAFAIFYLLTQPATVGTLVLNIFAGLGGAANSLSTFVNTILL